VYSNFRGKDDLFLAVREAEARRPELRRRVAEQHERLLDTVGGLLEEWTVRWDVEFKLPAREVVRGVYAISRGMGWRRCWPTSREPPTPSSSRRCSWPTRWA
jgi:AcrR family transcriptional regulator